MSSDPAKEEAVDILYQNHRGEIAWRRIVPFVFYRGTSDHHREEQYLLHALDADKNESRTFAVNDILCWGKQNMQRLLDAPLRVWDEAGVEAVGTVPTRWSPDEILAREG